ncbi:MAG: nuclear transport factor 2 family protein [candidate division KSB1 bacterium]|nr:nuclear transport factor 2 family protein [candidate division KSB1 bacterium]MDZ7301473.1 nuclear transport factor 2 family protein [candidate division KSB1 bacterium]MDZ7310875.1 nuclear transport factor 2 family protein [candidate division KSB1 bacterium]
MNLIFINLLLIVIILFGAAYLAKGHFSKMKKKDEREIWKKNAQNYNKQLDDFFAKKKEDDYKNLLHPKVSRYQPRLPHRIEGINEVMKWVKMDMEAPAAGATSTVQSAAELYDMTLVMTYNNMTQTKTGDKYVEGVSKVTRIWSHGKDGWKLVHEHISSG